MAEEQFHSLTFRDDMLEKVNKLAQVLEGIDAHPKLKGNLALHGGTALNLFLLDPQRLSLNLDLNYIASEDREQMLDDRDDFIQAICDVADELAMSPQKERSDMPAAPSSCFIARTSPGCPTS